MVPLIPILSILASGTLIVSLSYWTQLRLVVWLVIGLIIYFTYGRKHSKVQALNAAAPEPKPEPTMAD
jgi:APA family basic amino acid/polyamine antiporter